MRSFGRYFRIDGSHGKAGTPPAIRNFDLTFIVVPGCTGGPDAADWPIGNVSRELKGQSS
jgi:hypothetical protein